MRMTVQKFLFVCFTTLLANESFSQLMKQPLATHEKPLVKEQSVALNQSSVTESLKSKGDNLPKSAQEIKVSKEAKASQVAQAEINKVASVEKKPVAASNTKVADARKININGASATELAKALKGVGPKKAAAIVAFRDLHGPFQHVEELVEVKGIGPALLANNLNNLALN